MADSSCIIIYKILNKLHSSLLRNNNYNKKRAKKNKHGFNSKYMCIDFRIRQEPENLDLKIGKAGAPHEFNGTKS